MATPVDMTLRLHSHALAITHTTTVLEHRHGVGLTVMSVPRSAMPDDGSPGIANASEALGMSLRQRFAQPTRAVLVATMAALLMHESASAVVRRADRLRREDGDALRVRNTRVRELLEGCIDREVFPVLAQEEGFTRRSSLGELALESEELWVAATDGGEAAALVAMAGLGVFLVVVPVGHCARVLSSRVAEWVTSGQEWTR